jgi:calcium-binding protein CML
LENVTDEDKNGEIDQGELKRCFQRLEISIAEEDIKDLFEACDLHEHMGMKFNEFIVLLCLVYLLNEPAAEEVVSFLLQSFIAIFLDFSL